MRVCLPGLGMFWDRRFMTYEDVHSDDDLLVRRMPLVLDHQHKVC